jgi:tRNA (cytidine/uridine-2'-O-)-methyltransferase
LQTTDILIEASKQMFGKRETRLNVPERHVVLVAPEVHWNTGNIGRTCLGACAFLHLIKPLGFSLDSRQVKRAGLDYWHNVQLRVWESFRHFQAEMAPAAAEVALFSKNATRSFRLLSTLPRMFLIFGSETKGLPEPVLSAYPEATYHIPISGEIRSLNLSTAVGIALYESFRGADPPHAYRKENTT